MTLEDAREAAGEDRVVFARLDQLVDKGVRLRRQPDVPRWHAGLSSIQFAKCAAQLAKLTLQESETPLP